jgi:uncharacterized damage-inducible protein DinB
MTVRDLERVYDYSYWANRKIFSVLRQLTPEQFTQNVAGSYGSVRNTLVHILSAEWGWLDRCGGPARGPALKAEDYPTVDSLIDRWTTVEAHMRSFLAALTDADLVRSIEFKLHAADRAHVMRLGDLLQHGANHGVHHRGQVALLLRVLGHVPGNFDLLIYDSNTL